MWFFPRPVIVASAIVALALGAWGIWRPQPPRHRQKSEYAYEGGDTPRAEVSGPSPEERVANYTLWLAMLTGAMVYGILRQLGWMKRTDERLAEQIALATADFIAEHRPWLSVSIEIAGDLEWVDAVRSGESGPPKKRGAVALTFSVRNTGRAPALHTSVGAMFQPERTGPTRPPTQHLTFSSPAALQKTVSENMRRHERTEDTLGLTVFPGEIVSIPYYATANLDTVAKWIEWLDADGFPIHLPPVQTVKTVLAGCVDYSAPNGKRHQTGIVLALYHMTDESKSPASIDPRWGTIKKENLRLAYSHFMRTFGGGITD